MSVAVMTAMPTPEFRAGGTDFSERRRSGVSQGMLIDISATGDKTITWDADGAAQIGALTTIATIATDARIAAAYPGIAASAHGLATPQVRQVATLGGNLAQRSRCWYFRRADIDCLKKGGQHLPCPVWQSSLWRCLRSRQLRRAASLDHGGGSTRL
ncbi:FAD binding domain-containing protein [Bradyrhizobium liaoningense]|uniref:FAD binding domain-containing protein n=1 Tax=Bradyrhizobium liaoningense TaxID=43992 RepID=UPI0004B50989|nr:FAD binding domain-containing protein [Bradyrhizobium liaoningense]